MQKMFIKSNLLKPDGKKCISITYKEVYPKSVQSVQLNHSTQNTVLRVNAEMQYAFFETDDIRATTITTSHLTQLHNNMKGIDYVITQTEYTSL